MGTWNHDFSTDFDSHWYDQGSPQYWSWYGTPSDFGRIWFSGSPTSTTRFVYRDRRIKGNVIWEVAISFWGINDNTFQFGIKPHGGGYYDTYGIDFQVSNSATPTCKADSGGSSSSAVLPGTFTNTTVYWFKIVQEADDSITMWVKEDGGTYALWHDSVTPSTYWDYYEGDSGCESYWKTYYYTSNACDARVHQLITTADNQDDDGSWPISMECEFLKPGIFGASGLVVKEPEPALWVEDFGADYDDSGYDYLPTWERVGYEFQHGYETSNDANFSAYLLAEKLGARGVVDVCWKVNYQNVEEGVRVYYSIYDRITDNYVRLYTTRGATTETFRCGGDTADDGLWDSLLKTTDLITSAVWVWIRIKIELDGTVHHYFRYDGYEWELLGTISGKNPSKVQDAFKVYISVYDRSYTPGLGTFRLDEYRADSKFSEYIGDTWADLEGEMYPIQAIINSNYEVSILYDWERFMFFGTPLSDNLLNLDHFHYPLSTWSGNVDFLSTQIWPGMKFFLSSKGDFYLKADIAYIAQPTAITKHGGFRFFINGIELRLGEYYDTDLLGARQGIEIDGVGHTATMSHTNSRNIYIFELRGNHLTVSVDVGAYGTLYEVYNDTDFLGSPADYILTDLTLIHTISNTIRCYYLEILGEEGAPIDVTADIVIDTEPFDSGSIASFSGEGFASLKQGYFFHKTGLTGGTAGDLDGINPADIEGTGEELLPFSVCLVVTPTNDISFHVAEEDASAVSDPPDVIIPVTSPGDWAWKKVDIPYFDRNYNLYSNSAYTPDTYYSAPAKMNEGGLFYSLATDNDLGTDNYEYYLSYVFVTPTSIRVPGYGSGNIAVVMGVPNYLEVL